MRKNAEKVLNAFEKGESCNGQTISTDGDKLYSYSMLIGKRESGRISLVEYESAPSATTRSHIRAAEQFFVGKVAERF
jgi:hypothetical protein